MLLKSILISKSLDIKEIDKLGFSKTEITRTLEYGAELWMILKKIHNTAYKKSKIEGKTEGLVHLHNQFEEAHKFFVEKMKQTKFLNGVLIILQGEK